jgi:hypothetical protein
LATLALLAWSKLSRSSICSFKDTYQRVGSSWLLLLDILGDTQVVVSGGEIGNDTGHSVIKEQNAGLPSYLRHNIAILAILVRGGFQDLLMATGDAHHRAIRNKRLSDVEYISLRHWVNCRSVTHPEVYTGSTPCDCGFEAIQAEQLSSLELRVGRHGVCAPCARFWGLDLPARVI